MRLCRDIAALLALGALGVAGLSLSSAATYSAATTNPGQSFTAAADWVAPTGAATVPAGTLRGTVTLSATASDAGSGVASVRLQRSPAGAATWTDVCTDASSPYSCAFNTTAVADGRYDVRAIATDNAANVGTSAVVADRLVDNLGPTVNLADPGDDVRGTITLAATASDGAGSGVASVRIQRSLADADNWTDVCTDASSPYACALSTTSLSDDSYDLRAIALDVAGNTTTSALRTIQVDNTPPTVSLANPGATLSGTVTLTTTPDDADSGVASVTIQRAPANGSTWTDVCVISTDPWTCAFATTAVADGLYDLRAIAVDSAGNTTTSSTVQDRFVNNTTISSVSLNDPGSPLRAAITLTANANSTLGVASVKIQRAPTATTTWTDVCSDTTSPYSCSLDTAAGATPNGVYDFRAVMTTTIGTTVTSATVANRTIDNSLVLGIDVQTTNKTGGKAGKMEAGDRIALTYSEAMKASTLIAGWTGTTTVNVFVRVTDAGGVETTRLQIDASGTASGLGSYVTGGNFLRNNRTIVFAATATLSTGTGGGSVVTITLGAVTSGNGLRTHSASTALKWTPSATATNLAGSACSAALVTETGAADRDY